MKTVSERPRQFNQVLGQPHVTAVLYRACQDPTFSHQLLFVGPPGVGKTTTARIVAAALNCAEGNPCGSCDSCSEVFSGNHIDVVEIDAATYSSVTEIRELTDSLDYQPDKYRVIIVDESQALSGKAFQALLKTIEEPPPRTVFILVTTQPGSIPANIKSRCWRFDFKPVSSAKISELLYGMFSLPHDLLDHIAKEASGSPRRAILEAEKALVNNSTDLLSYIQSDQFYMFPYVLLGKLLSESLSEAYSYMSDLSSHFSDYRKIFEELIVFIRDMVIFNQSIQLDVPDVRFKAIHALINTHKLTNETLVRCLKVLWDASTKVHDVNTPEATAILAISMLQEVLAPGRITATAEDARNILG